MGAGRGALVGRPGRGDLRLGFLKAADVGLAGADQPLVGVGEEAAEGGFLVRRQAGVARGAGDRVGLVGRRALERLGQGDLLLHRLVGGGVLVEPRGDPPVVEVTGQIGGAVERVVEGGGGSGGEGGELLVDAAEVFAHQ